MRQCTSTSTTGRCTWRTRQNCQGDRTGSGSAGETGEGLVHSSVLRLCGDQRPGSLLQIPGFYNGNPTELNALTETEEAKLFVDYVGSVEQVLHLAEQDYAAGDYRRAAKAASYAVFADPANQKARLLNADAWNSWHISQNPASGEMPI